MNSASLELIIRNLIASQREGDYWDFKAKPHADKGSLLHDVLCLANSLHRGDRYLIFGVEDPLKGTAIVGLGPAEVGRKTQSNFIDFLRDQKFAGGNRPTVNLVTLTLDGLEVDVLVIADVPAKPYWLTENYTDGKRLGPQVYTRVGDTNTPVDKSADVDLVEKMWRQRFGLDLSPAERMRQLLREPAGWDVDFDSKRNAYHRSFPDYQIKRSATEPFWEPYSHSFLNKNSFISTAEFVYNATTLFELEFVYLDEMRLLLPTPDTEQLFLLGHEMWYYYYDLSTPVGDCFTFLTPANPGLESRGSTAPFLVFHDNTDHKAFRDYLFANQAQLAGIIPSTSAQSAVQALQRDGHSPSVDLLEIDCIMQLYSIWRGTTYQV
jgi:hypothetical protein